MEAQTTPRLEAETTPSFDSSERTGQVDVLVGCLNCKLSRRFRTIQGVDHFKFEHSNHEVVEGEDARQFLDANSAIGDLETSSAPEDLASPSAATAPTAEQERPLLLARSSYVQEGERTEREARRVSAALREFRWNAQSPYAIGVLFDDMLSIETSTGLIGSGLVKRIQELGYAFVTVRSSRGTPTAWFKQERRAGPERAFTVLTESDMVGRRDPVSEDDRQERERWDRAFLSLLILVKDPDSEGLRKATGALATFAKGTIKL